MMRNVRCFFPALLCVSMLMLSACGSKKVNEEVLVVDEGEAIGVEESLDSKPMGIGEGRTTEGMLPVYFNFDASEIRNDQISRIEVNADFMKQNPEYKVRIEGNCDPRGTKEYNMALGERRALAAKRYLINLGVPESSLSTVSYGDERLLLYGQDELSWAQNRRDDFVVVK